MCENWIKVNVSIFEDEKLRYIEFMPEGEVIEHVWIRLLLLAGKVNDGGKIYLNKEIPYTVQILSSIFHRPEARIKVALDTLRSLKMIDIDENKIITITNWDKYQNVEGMDKIREQSRLRMRKKRAKDREEAKSKENEKALEDVTLSSYVTVTQENEHVTPKNKNKEIDIEKDIEKKEKEKKVLCLKTAKEEKHEDLAESKAVEIINYAEKLTGKTGIFKFEAVVLAIKIHGGEYVKMAVERSIEAGKINIKYVNGILRNWTEQGYPKAEGGSLNGHRGIIADGEKFKGIKPKKPRKFTDADAEKAKVLL